LIVNRSASARGKEHIVGEFTRDPLLPVANDRFDAGKRKSQLRK
jgi:hypothetical protein